MFILRSQTILGLFVIVLSGIPAQCELSDLPRTDLLRARMAKPPVTSRVLGAHPTAAFQLMNKVLKDQAVQTVPCELWQHDALNSVALQLLSKRHSRLNSLYTDKQDNRQLRFDDKSKLEASWHLEGALPTGSIAYNITRDGKCAELVMWWTHHLTQPARDSLAKLHHFQLPLMPIKVVQSNDTTYGKQISCSDCHTSGNVSKTTATPAFPSDNSINALPHDCPINSTTGLPPVWYANSSIPGKRLKRCDADFDPPCQMCEGIGGLVWGDQEHQIDYTTCRPMAGPKEIQPDNITSPVWPMAFTVHEKTILINQIDEGGRFPGADPCAPHKFENQTE